MNIVDFWWYKLILLVIVHNKITIRSFTTFDNKCRNNKRHNNNNFRRSLENVISISTLTRHNVVLLNDDDGFVKDDNTALNFSSNAVPTNYESPKNNDTDQQKQHQSSKQTGLPLTSAILRISYDGARFSGWSAANKNNDISLSSQRREKKYRRRETAKEFQQQQLPTGVVRSVEGVLKKNLAKLYGDVDPNTRIIVEGSSRTDKGVHALYMIAQIYCLKKEFAISSPSKELSDNYNDRNNKSNNNYDDANTGVVISGKRIPHPATPSDDSCFEVLPMNANLSKIAFTLNRMTPEDIQIVGIAPTPSNEKNNIFHASLSSKSKTYEYRISTGYIYDPILRKVIWHVGSSDLDMAKMKKACELFRGTHAFSAFQGSPRGSDEKRKRLKQRERSSSSSTTICSVYCIRVDIQHPTIAHDEEYYFPGVDAPIRNYNIVVKGDRFLYKMVRFIVGSFVALGNGKLELEDIQRAIDTGSWDILNDPSERRKEFKCAPAYGLSLTNVDYGDEVSLEWQPLRD